MVETHLEPIVEAPQMARAFLREALQSWSLDHLGDVAGLLVSELVTNVVTHVDSPMTLRAEFDGRSVYVGVGDDSDAAPVVQHPDTDDEHGRGMLLIAQLASEWGTDQHPDDGKTVWFRLDIPT